jgi:hypothetical protein
MAPTTLEVKIDSSIVNNPQEEEEEESACRTACKVFWLGFGAMVNALAAGGSGEIFLSNWEYESGPTIGMGVMSLASAALTCALAWKFFQVVPIRQNVQFVKGMAAFVLSGIAYSGFCIVTEISREHNTE